MAIFGTIQQALLDLRNKINDNVLDGKFTDLDYLRQLGIAWDKVLQDLNSSMGLNPLYCTCDVTYGSGLKEFLLPALVGQLAQAAILQSVAGTGEMTKTGVVVSYGLNTYTGQNMHINPPFIIFDNPLDSDTDVRLTFVPAANLYMHVGTVDHANVSGSSLVMTETPDVGEYDPRPNGFVGCIARLIGSTALPSGYAYMPQQERRIVAYDPASQTLTLNLDWDAAMIPGTGDVTYEIVTMTDPALMYLAAIEAARSICAQEQRRARAADLQAEYTLYLNTARRKYTNLNQARTSDAPDRIDQYRARQPRRII